MKDKKEWGTPKRWVERQIARTASLEHLAVKDLVLFLTWRACRTDTTSHEQAPRRL